IHVDPDVLLVDEVLAVGDEGFTHKCLDKFAEFRRRNKTVLLVTHSLNLVEKFCDEALWLDAGRAMTHGDPKRVIGAYLTAGERAEEHLLTQTTARAALQTGEAPAAVMPAARADGDRAKAPEGRDSQPPADASRAVEGRWGSREVTITEVVLVGKDGQP